MEFPTIYSNIVHNTLEFPVIGTCNNIIRNSLQSYYIYSNNLFVQLQEKLADSRNKELEKDEIIESMKNDFENLDVMYHDTKLEVQKCEDMIEQLTRELNTSQEDLSMTQNRVKECEENIKNLKDKNQMLQVEVWLMLFIVTFIPTG